VVSRDELRCPQEPTIEAHENIHFNIILPLTPRFIKLFLLSIFGLNADLFFLVATNRVVTSGLSLILPLFQFIITVN
jgi:hypothetical protein